MSWLKKTFSKVRRSVKRASRGKFSIGHQIRSQHPKWMRKALDKLRWSKLVKSRLAGNNSAAVLSSSGGVDSGVGYQYHGRTLSEMF